MVPRRRSRASRRIRCNPNPAPRPRLGTGLRRPARCDDASAGAAWRRGCVRATAAGRAPLRSRGSIPRRPVRRRRRDTRLRRPGPRRARDVPGSGADDDAGGAAEDAGDVRHGSADDPAAPSAVMDSFACRRRRCRSQFDHYFRGIYYIKRRCADTSAATKLKMRQLLLQKRRRGARDSPKVPRARRRRVEPATCAEGSPT